MITVTERDLFEKVIRQWSLSLGWIRGHLFECQPGNISAYVKQSWKLSTSKTFSTSDNKLLISWRELPICLELIPTWFAPPLPSSVRCPSAAPSLSPPAPPPSGGSGRSWFLLLLRSAGRCRNAWQRPTAASRLRRCQTSWGNRLTMSHPTLLVFYNPLTVRWRPLWPFKKFQLLQVE